MENVTRECQNPYNHNPYSHNPYRVEILIDFLEILIGLLEILIGLLEILIGQFRDFDFDFFGSFGCRGLANHHTFYLIFFVKPSLSSTLSSSLQAISASLPVNSLLCLFARPSVSSFCYSSV